MSEEEIPAGYGDGFGCWGAGGPSRRSPRTVFFAISRDVGCLPGLCSRGGFAVMGSNDDRPANCDSNEPLNT
jgi:hypothetical protein